MDIIRYRTSGSPAALVGVRDEGQVFGLPGVPSLAALWALPLAEIGQRVRDRRPVPSADVTLLPPVDGRTEVWAAGVTYATSREARVEESERSADVYQQVYEAERPERVERPLPGGLPDGVVDHRHPCAPRDLADALGELLARVHDDVVGAVGPRELRLRR